MQRSNQYDVIFDVIANTSYNKCKRKLTRNGIYISNIATVRTIFGSLLHPVKKIMGIRKKQTYNWVKPEGENLEKISKLIQRGFVKPIVDKVFPLSEVRQAQEYCETGQKRGKVVLKI
ncbi:zinc-binding dehydrogenase [Bacillus carboniphilus]|uniref:Zinc-binding dehydrogenase n=1 Tax=Bacillus carboniphilus TaxID=86663 RepID=A0ABY9JUD8_9BACI|nr:zinc-binding dehydrogenase [Bacillus carboniphilus]WLR42987.1 zinc-binding dehydrogenase [Bacillus carboniphilus]